MLKRALTLAEVAQEIRRLGEDDDVRLAVNATQLKHLLKKKLDALRDMKKLGEALRAQGVTEETLRELVASEENENDP